MSDQAATEAANPAASVRQLRTLSKRARAATMRNASRLHVPPSAFAAIGEHIISKRKS